MFCILKKYVYILLMFQNINHGKQDILLMIPNGEVTYEGQWYHLPVKKLSALLREITSKHYGDFYCLNAFIPLEQETNLNRIKE